MFSLAPTLAKRLPFYYGWVIMAATGLVSFTSVAFGPGVVGVLFSSMSSEFGWSNSVIPGAILLGSFMVVLVGPISGYVLDRHGPRYVATTGAVVMTICLVALGGISSVVLFYVVFGVGHAVFVGVTRVAVASTTAQWFVRRRGSASIVGSAATALGFVVLPLVVAVVMEQQGWRVAWVTIGIITFVMAVPASWLLLTARPEDVGQQVDGDRTEEEAQRISTLGRSAGTEVQWTLAEAIRTPTLWVLVMGMALQGIAIYGVTFHMVPHLEQQGLSVTQAAITFTLGGTAMTLSGFFWGPVADRIHTRYLFGTSTLVLIGFVVMLMLVSSPWMVVPTGILMGLGFGGLILVERLAFANYFGRSSAGAIQGFVTPILVVVSGSGALMAGIAFSITGSYSWPFSVFVAGMFIAIVIVLLVPTPVKKGGPTPQPVGSA